MYLFYTNFFNISFTLFIIQSLCFWGQLSPIYMKGEPYLYFNSEMTKSLALLEAITVGSL